MIISCQIGISGSWDEVGRDCRWALVKTAGQCRVSPELKLGQSGLWPAWASLISVSHPLPCTVGLTPSPPSALRRHCPFAGWCLSPPPPRLGESLSLSLSFQSSSPRPTSPLVSSWDRVAQNWMQFSKLGLENSERVNNTSVTRMRYPGSEEEQSPGLRAWKEEQFKNIPFESSRVQSQPEDSISWRKFCNWLYIMPLLLVLQLQSPHTWVQWLWSLHSSKHNSLMQVHQRGFIPFPWYIELLSHCHYLFEQYWM